MQCDQLHHARVAKSFLQRWSMPLNCEHWQTSPTLRCLCQLFLIAKRKGTNKDANENSESKFAVSPWHSGWNCLQSLTIFRRVQTCRLRRPYSSLWLCFCLFSCDSSGTEIKAMALWYCHSPSSNQTWGDRRITWQFLRLCTLSHPAVHLKMHPADVSSTAWLSD